MNRAKSMRWGVGLTLLFLGGAECLFSETGIDVVPLAPDGLEAVSAQPDMLSALDAMERRIATLEQLLADRDAIILQLSAAVDPEATADGGQIEMLADENVRLAAELDAVRAERDEIRADFNRLFQDDSLASRPAVDAVEGAEEKLSRRIAELEAKVVALTEQQKTLEAERDVMLAAHEIALQSAVAQALRELEESRDTLVAAHAREMTDATSRMQTLEWELEQLRVKYAAQETRLTESQATLSRDELQQELHKLRTIDASRRVAMDEILLQIGILREQLAARDQTLGEWEVVLAGVRADLTAAEQNLQEKDASLEELRSGNLALEEELRSGKLALEEEMRAGMQASEQTVAALQAQIEQLSLGIAAVQESLSQRESELVEQAAAYRELQDSHERLTSDLRVSREEGQQLTADLERVQAAKGERDVEIGTIREELDKTLLIDARRKQTLDETIASLAFAEKREREIAAQHEEVQSRLSGLEQAWGDRIEQLADRNRLLEEEIKRMEIDLERTLSGAYTVAESPVPSTVDATRLQELEAAKAMLEAQLQALQLASVPVEGEDQVEWQRERAVLESQMADAFLEITRLREAGAAKPVEAAEAVVDPSAVDAMAAELAGATAELSQVRQELDTLRRVDVRETDLFRELDESSALLRDKLVETEAGRQRLQRQMEELHEEYATLQVSAEQEKGRAVETAAALRAALEREAEYQQLLERIVPELRGHEEQTVALRREREDMIARLLQREEDIKTLQVELEKREHRLARAERVADVLERTRSEVEQAQRRQRLNMHYNMAAVYGREGRFAEAEFEYLQALRLDPADADVHFNLGILYDDELKQPDKAVLHYRRYLQLNPHGVDADRVRSWLLRLEMGQGR